MKFFKTICALLIFLLPLLVSESGFAQSFTVTPSNTSFTVNVSAGLTAPIENVNALTLNIESGNAGYNLSASITTQTPAGVVFPASPFTLKLVSITGTKGQMSGEVTGDINLAASPASASLATNASKTTKNNIVQWLYNLTLNPVGYTVPPGTYVFTVTIIYSDGGSPISRSFNINVTVQSAMGMSLTQGQPTTISFNNTAAYQTGVTIIDFHSLQVASNMLWQVSVAASSPYFSSGSAGASANMPCSIMKIKASDVSTYLPLSTSATTIKTGSRGDATALGNSPTFDVNFNPGYDYNPGVYNLSLTYTLTSQ